MFINIIILKIKEQLKLKPNLVLLEFKFLKIKNEIANNLYIEIINY